MSQTVDRAVRSLLFIADGPRSVRDVAQHLDVHPTTALRILQTLHSWRLVDKRADGDYRLGATILDLGQRALESLDLRDVAAPFMQKLGDATNETVHLAILENQNVVYIDKVDSRRPVRMYSRVGIVAPLHCTGVAKAILAFVPPAQQRRLVESTDLHAFTPHTLTTPESLLADLAAARERGYAIDDEEHELGIRCVSAPILYADGNVAGSVSVSVSTARINYEKLLAFVGPLLDAAHGISRELGHRRR
ncbi:IclR family transcriptional regulator [Phytohabitans kaempferiae]|uniref:IclR family transcriptional regulator n=1 Tax=Phytohabitans kaempferiae TaxID=1620943 RepID=A0ABV6M4B2_9ACTN